MANVVEHNESSKKNKPAKGTKLGPKGRVSKNLKFQEKCFKCDKVGHKSYEYWMKKKALQEK